MADHSLTGAFRIALPKDLVSESKRADKTQERAAENRRHAHIVAYAAV